MFKAKIITKIQNGEKHSSKPSTLYLDKERLFYLKSQDSSSSIPPASVLPRPCSILQVFIHPSFLLFILLFFHSFIHPALPFIHLYILPFIPFIHTFQFFPEPAI